MLTFAEELLLLPADEDGVFLPIQKDAFECVIVGAVLMDLAFAYRIDTDLQTLVISDYTPTDNPMLDRILAKSADRQEAMDTRTWIRELSADEAATIREQALAGLVERGILKLQDKKFPEAFRSQHYFTAVYPDYAVAEACINCHNNHKGSPRTDAKVGDVMGGVVIRIPID